MSKILLSCMFTNSNYDIYVMKNMRLTWDEIWTYMWMKWDCYDYWNGYELPWHMLKSVIGIYMDDMIYIRWIMWNGYDYWMIWSVRTYESVIVIHNEWHEFVMTTESIWDCIDDWKMIYLYIW